MTTDDLRGYEVIWEGRVREIYYVDAHSEDEARETWFNFECAQSESFDGEVVEVRPNE